MSSTKHAKTKTPSDADLKRNPGIGASPGTYKLGEMEALDGESTFVGDVENDTTEGGGVRPQEPRRTNK